jgi:Family of unknown function (DUF6064)
MQIPFTVDEFYGVFRAYNLAVWPAHVGLVGLAGFAVLMLVFRQRWSGVGISAILAFLWVWMALAYHLAFFSSINPLAYVFAALSLVGAAVIAWQGVVRRRLEFRMDAGVRAWVGAGLVVFALLVYPAWSSLAGHRYPDSSTFGLPCPTTIFTIGLLAFLVAPYPRSTFVIPVMWCFVGSQAAFLFDVPQDLGLVLSGVAGIVLLLHSKASPHPARVPT